MTNGTPVIAELLAWEAVTSLGECAAETALLWEAEVINTAASRFVMDDGTRAVMCSSPALPPDLLGVQRLAALAEMALERLASKSGGPTLHGISTLLLCLPERMALQANTFALTSEGKALVQTIKSMPLLDPGIAIEAFPFGRAAGALALQRAAELAASGKRVLWGGVDSQHDWDVLEALSRQDRLLTADNVDGVRPGEAAAFAVLRRPEGSTRPVILGLGLGRQEAPSEANPVSRADGLARAMRSATSPLRDLRQRCGYWLTDTTHEAVATQRLQHVLTACADIVGLQTALHSPAKAMGDAGAASLPLFAALAAEAWRHGSADDETALLAACSDNGACGAVLLGASLSRFTT